MTTEPEELKLLDCHDVAKILGIHYITVERYAAAGEIKSIKMRTSFRFKREYITEYLMLHESPNNKNLSNKLAKKIVENEKKNKKEVMVNE